MAWNTIRLNILVVMMVFAIGFGTPLHSARAEMWGTNMIAALVQKMLDRLDRYIEGVLLSQLKSAAIRMLDKQVDQMFGGGGRRSSFCDGFQGVYSWGIDQLCA